MASKFARLTFISHHNGFVTGIRYSRQAQHLNRNGRTLGNPAGRPNDLASQAATMEMALDLLESATGPRTTRQSPIRWSDSPDWKLDYSNVERISADELERRRLEFLRQKEIANARRAEDGLKTT